MSAERKPQAGEKWLWVNPGLRSDREVEIVHSEPDTLDHFVVRYYDNGEPFYAMPYVSDLKPMKRTVREIVNEAELPLLPNEREQLAVAIEMEYPELKQS